MILKCPECNTRFIVNEALLEPHGRKVKCAKCTHVWFQEPNRIDGEPAPKVADAPKIEEIPQSVRPIPEGSGLPVPTYDWNFSVMRFVSLFVAFVFIGTALLIGFRDKIVPLWEPSAKIYDMIGMSVLTEGHGIAIEDVTVVESFSEGKKRVTVSGFLRNTTDIDRHVPHLKVTLEGRGDKEEFVFRPSVTVLSLGQSSKFTYVHETEMQNGQSATIRFVLDKNSGEAGIKPVTTDLHE